jgi:MFS family permease
LISIATDLDSYGQSNWIVIAYLLTYSSFLIVFARLSDITGRKSALLTALSFFTIASLACGLAKTLTQLIVFRVFQGIGGAGVHALTMVLVLEVVSKRRFGAVYATVNLVFVVASAVGPVVGGAITTHTTWRWCFYLK